MADSPRKSSSSKPLCRLDLASPVEEGFEPGRPLADVDRTDRHRAPAAAISFQRVGLTCFAFTEIDGFFDALLWKTPRTFASNRNLKGQTC